MYLVGRDLLFFNTNFSRSFLIMLHYLLRKVRMQGVAVGRAVDLNMLKGYEDLIDELEKMFEIKGELRLPNKWAVVFTDDENDMMLVGDDPWV